MRIPDLDTGLPVTFANSNNVTFGTTGESITASVLFNVSAGTTSNNLTAITFSNSNNVSFGLNGSTVTASYAFNLSAGTTSNNLNAVTFSNSNDIMFGLNGSTLTAEGIPVSSFEPFPFVNTQTQTFNGASISYGVAFQLPENISASFVRIPVLMTTNSTTLATTAATLSASVQILSTINIGFYTMGIVGNSKSLQTLATGSAGFTQQNSISVAANGTQYSISQHFTYQVEGNSSSTSSSYAASTSNYSFVTTNWQSLFSSLRWVDIPFATSLTAGAYWLIIGMSTSSATNSTGISAASNCNVIYSNHYGISQADSHWGVMGSTNLTSGGFEGAASFSTAGGGTTLALQFSNLSSVASEVRPYFQILRSA